MILLNRTDRPIAIEGTGLAPIPSKGMATLSPEQEKAVKKNKTVQMLIEKGLLSTSEPTGEQEVVDTVKQVMDSAKTQAPVTQETLTAENGAQAATISTDVKSVELGQLKDE